MSLEKDIQELPQELLDLRLIMMSQHGRRFILRLLGKCGIMRLSFINGGEEGRRATDFNEGKRSVGNELFVEIDRAAPDMYLRMMEEYNAERNRDDNAQHPADDPVSEFANNYAQFDGDI